MATYVKKYSQSLSANGNATELGYVSRDAQHDGDLVVHVSGTFGGGTFKVQFLAEDDTWKDISTASFTSAADKVLTAPIDTNIRVVLSGATSPAIYYEISVRGEAYLSY